MQVKTNTPEFNPVKLILESQEEVDFLYNIMNMNVVTCSQVFGDAYCYIFYIKLQPHANKNNKVKEIKIVTSSL